MCVPQQKDKDVKIYLLQYFSEVILLCVHISLFFVMLEIKPGKDEC